MQEIFAIVQYLQHPGGDYGLVWAPVGFHTPPPLPPTPSPPPPLQPPANTLVL